MSQTGGHRRPDASSDPVALVHTVIERHCGVDAGTLAPSTRLAEDLGLESIDAAELVGSLEEASGSVIELATLEQVETVGSVIELVRAGLERDAQTSTAGAP